VQRVCFVPKKTSRVIWAVRRARYGDKSPHFHTKIGITMIIPMMIPDIFTFVARFTFIS
jgi:hypothetical protein